MDLTINDRTTVPLAWMAAIIPIILAAMFWLSVIYVNEQANAQAIIKVDARVDAEYTVLLDIRDRVIRMETQASKHH